MSGKQTAASPQIPRTLAIAAPAGAYLGITGPAELDWTATQTLLLAGGAFLILLFLPQLTRALGRAAKAQARRSKAKTSDKK